MAISGMGVDLRLAHALQLKAISYAKVKTDKVDSAMLAELLRAGLIPEAHQIDRAMRSRLRLVVRRSVYPLKLNIWVVLPGGENSSTMEAKTSPQR